MAEPDREAYEAAERLVREAHAKAEEAARAAEASTPPNGWGEPGGQPPAVPDFAPCSRCVDAAKGTLPPELLRQVADALRELLIALRAVLDYSIDGSTAPPRPRARRGGHPDLMSSRTERFRLPKELQLAAAAAVALVLSFVLPWYQKSLFVDGDVVQSNVSALGAFTFVEAAILLVAVAVVFLVWARSQKKGFHLPGGDGVAIILAGGWAMLLLVYRLFDKPDIEGAGATMGIQWGIFGAMLAAGALIAAGLRVQADRRARAAESRRRRRRLGRVRRGASASARRTAARATRPRSPSSCATARRGRATSATRRPPASTTRRRRASRRTRRRRPRAASAARRGAPSGCGKTNRLNRLQGSAAD